MDEIDLGLHELSNQLKLDKNAFGHTNTTGVAGSLSSTSSAFGRPARYTELLKTFVFYWSTAILLFLFLIWASPSYFYTTSPVGIITNNHHHHPMPSPPPQRFVWSRFFRVWVIMYVLILSCYVSANAVRGLPVFP